MLNIDSIQNGIVIDHIKAGTGRYYVGRKSAAVASFSYSVE